MCTYYVPGSGPSASGTSSHPMLITTPGRGHCHLHTMDQKTTLCPMVAQLVKTWAGILEEACVVLKPGFFTQLVQH